MKKEQKIIELRRSAKLKVAELETEIAVANSETAEKKEHCERQCAAAEDDPKTMMELPQQTVYCDGSEHSARIVARRMINKMPHIPTDGYLFVHIIRDDDGDYFVSISARGKSPDDNIVKIFSKGTHTAESEAEFVEEAREMLTTDEEKNNSNSHVSEPMASALDAVFGGNPVERVDNLISDTIKDGKEGGNE